MRGGERLVKKCSWMSDICSRLYHSTEKYKTFSCRCPSSVMVNNRFRSADYLPCQLFNFGMIATGNHNFERFAALCNTPGGKPRDASPLAVHKLLVRTVYYWPTPTEADAKASITSSFLFVFNNSPLSFFSFLYSLSPNLKNLQKSTLLL